MGYVAGYVAGYRRAMCKPAVPQHSSPDANVYHGHATRDTLLRDHGEKAGTPCYRWRAPRGQGPARPATREAPWQRTARTLRDAGWPAGRWAVLKSFKGRTLIPVRAKKRADVPGSSSPSPTSPTCNIAWRAHRGGPCARKIGCLFRTPIWWPGHRHPLQ